MELTQELVKSRFDYHQDGKLIWKVKTTYRTEIGQIAGFRHKGLQRNIISCAGKKYLLSRIIFLWHKGYLPEMVDHSDNDALNDRIDNLRDASRAENSKNRRSKVSGSSKYLGVIHLKESNKFRARIRIEGKNKQIGNFKSEDDAGLAYNKAAVKYHGEFANLNIIKP